MAKQKNSSLSNALAVDSSCSTSSTLTNSVTTTVQPISAMNISKDGQLWKVNLVEVDSTGKVLVTTLYSTDLESDVYNRFKIMAQKRFMNKS